MAGFFFVLLLVVVPYTTLKDPERRENNLLYAASLILGFITCGFHLSQAIALYVSAETLEDFRSYVPLRNTITAEQQVKRATANKLSAMTKNALDVLQTKDADSILNSHYGQALKQYETNGKKYVTAGGFMWSWSRLLGRNQSFSGDGIWLPARMVASNIAQYVVAVYLLIGGLYLTSHVEAEYDKEWAKRELNRFVNTTFDRDVQDDVADVVVANVSSLVSQYLTSMEGNGADFGCAYYSSSSTEEFMATYCAGDSLQCDPTADVNYLCPLLDQQSVGSLDAASQAALLSASGFDDTLLREVAYQAAQQAVDEGVDSLFPSEKYMIVVPLYVATFLAFIVAFSLAILYIPSVTRTILKLRCGHIPTLHNKNFNRFRCAPDQVALLSGSLFWGSLFSGTIVGGMIGLIIFFFVSTQSLSAAKNY